jgi:propionate CoA-transferase
VVDSFSDPKSVRVPGMLVDYIVVSDGAEHDQTFGVTFDESLVTSRSDDFTLPTMGFSERKIIGQRALKEIRAGDIVNLGIGLPESVAMVAAETGRLKEFTLTVESGPTGGVPASGLSFGCSHFPRRSSISPRSSTFTTAAASTSPCSVRWRWMRKAA